ncbi:hypothetical protein DENSPDRAFT_854288 [Dentipellis sp. KUC8613]|nr:hypothetical protein DENSPDRAFT_854288 [Dentipellis sp. KUC8613]
MLRPLFLIFLILPVALASVGSAHDVVPNVQHLLSEPVRGQLWMRPDKPEENPLNAMHNDHRDRLDEADALVCTKACLDPTQEYYGGSDECSEICSNERTEGEETRRKSQEAEWNVRKRGFEIRSTYIAATQNAKAVREDDLIEFQDTLAVLEEEAAHIIAMRENAEELLAAVLRSRTRSCARFITAISPQSKAYLLVKALEALKDIERDVNFTRDDIISQEFSLQESFNTTAYGKEGEWWDQQYIPLTKDAGDYTYQVVLFRGAARMSKNGDERLDLGTFASWNSDTNVTEGSSEYYKEQMYTNGTQCWNGVRRSVRFKIECGLENAILTVEEPEECKYLFTGTSPAVCFALEEDEAGEDL